jgi:Lanthionine synthetase C-like protein
MWGTPGSMLGCLFMYEMTGEERFKQLFLEQALRLLAGLEQANGFKIWSCELYAMNMRALGLVHGFAGNMAALLRGWNWLDRDAQNLVASTARETLAATAIEKDGEVNWPVDLNRPEQKPLCQVCHGAPGIILVFADSPFGSPSFERLLAEGGDLVWKAGPLAKGSNLCHGTAGNGYAFLKLYKRTKNPLWLERARAFAATAVGQFRVARTEFGRGRYTLWTGDIGLAVYLWDCIRAEAAFPTLDVF